MACYAGFTYLGNRVALIVQLECGERLFVGDVIFEVRRCTAKKVEVSVFAPSNVPIARENLLGGDGLGIINFKRTRGRK